MRKFPGVSLCQYGRVLNMTTLRQSFIRELVIRGMSPRTQESYIFAIYRVAKYYHQSPDQLTDEQLKDYIYYLAKEKNLAASSVNVVVSAMRSFYHLVLHRSVDYLRELLPYANRAVRRPQVFSTEEIERLLTVGCVHPKPRAFLMTVYGAGLRLDEACHLKPRHINRARMQIRVEQGKGRKDRYTLLPPVLLAELDRYWRMFRPKYWLFPAATEPQAPMDPRMAQKIFYAAVERAGLPRRGGIHCLRQNAECRKMPSEASRSPKFLRNSCVLGLATRHFQRPCKNARSLSPGR